MGYKLLLFLFIYYSICENYIENCDSTEKDWTYRLRRVWAGRQPQSQPQSGCRLRLQVAVVYGGLYVCFVGVLFNVIFAAFERVNPSDSLATFNTAKTCLSYN